MRQKEKKVKEVHGDVKVLVALELSFRGITRPSHVRSAIISWFIPAKNRESNERKTDRKSETLDLVTLSVIVFASS